MQTRTGIITSLLIATKLCSCQSQTDIETSSPNLLFIMADQYRSRAIGYLGEEPVITPNLDSLARTGVHCLNAISSYPVSSPARGMLMTGQYPTKSGVPENCNSRTAPYEVEIRTDARCWSDVLHDKGYNMGYLGKWHLDAPYEPYVDTYNNHGAVAWNEWCPPERRHGFDHWVAYGTYDRHLNPMYWENEAPRDSFFYVDQWGPSYEADRAIEFLTDARSRLKKDKQPFALVVSMNPPHTGYDLVPEQYKEMYKDLDVDSIAALYPHIPPKGTTNGDFFRKNLRDYYACITGVDTEVGRILQYLKDTGLHKNTIVVFTSDHGDSMGMHENIGKNIYYDEAMLIPMIISWPEQLKPRIDRTLQIGFADLYPTLLSLMGFTQDIPAEVETYDLSQPLLTGESGEIIQPYYRLYADNLLKGYRGLRDNRYTFAVHATDGKPDEWVLFDRHKDPYQMKNIAAESQELTEKYTALLQEWLIRTDDPFAVCLNNIVP